jgi:hypothetical protein
MDPNKQPHKDLHHMINRCGRCNTLPEEHIEHDTLYWRCPRCGRKSVFQLQLSESIRKWNRVAKDPDRTPPAPAAERSETYFRSRSNAGPIPRINQQ